MSKRLQNMGLEELIPALERVHRGEYAETLRWARKLRDLIRCRETAHEFLTDEEGRSVAEVEDLLRKALADY